MGNLTQRQREQVLAILKPLIDEEIKNWTGPQIKEELRRLVATQPGSYTERILAGGRSPRKSELPPAARVFARLGLIQAASQGDRSTALDLARALDVEGEYKSALSAGSAEGGGLLLVDDPADEVIELLRPMSVMRQIGARTVPIPRGMKSTPRIDVGVTSGYVAEGEAIPTSELKTGAVILTAKKLATLVVFTNELLQFGTGVDLAVNVDQIVLDDMLASIGETEDTKFLFGSGSQAEPLGVTNQVAAANKFDANATVNVANVVEDLSKAITVLRTANVKFRRPAWIFSGRTEVFLQTLLNANGQFVFRQEVENGKLLRWPFFATENIPNDLGAGSDESLIILVDASEVMLGDVSQVSVDRSAQATVKIDGQDVNLFETDRSAIRVRTWNDLRLRHDVGAAVIEKVKWGA